MAQLDPQTETAAANQALSELLIPAIVDLDNDTSAAAKELRKHFAPVRDAMQRQFPWNFCEREKTLNVDPDADASFDFSYSYALPADPYCLKALRLYGVHRSQWKVRGRSIVTNVGPQIKLIYTARVVDVPQWDALFKAAFVPTLAYACKMLCKDQERLAEIKADAQNALSAAWPADASEGEPAELPTPDILLARDGDCRDYPWSRW